MNKKIHKYKAVTNERVGTDLQIFALFFQKPNKVLYFCSKKLQTYWFYTKKN